MRARASLLIALFGVSCASCASTATEDAAPVSLDGWRFEPITLPPEFAPTLPSGEELLLFAPGMFDAEAEDFWSYAFVIRFDETGIDRARLESLLEVYYDGLILRVGAARGADVGDDPATVRLASVGRDHYNATVRLIDAFVTLAPITLNLDVRIDERTADTTLLRFQASPQPAGHAVWRSLEAAVASLDV